MKKFVNGEYLDLTDSEIKEIEDAKERDKAESFHKPLSTDEVIDIILKAQVNKLDIPDQTSVKMMGYYPEFADIIGQTVELGFKFRYNDELYKTIQESLTIQEHYPPGTGTESLYTKIDVLHLGNKYDPVPYNGNMALENGKYYTQDGVMYKCNRDTVNPVYHNLSELVGLYVEVC